MRDWRSATVATCLLSWGSISVGYAHELVMSRGGQTRCCIVLAQDAIAPENTAAKELQDHLEQVIGGTVPLQSEDTPWDSDVRLFVGPTQALKQAFPDLNLDLLGHDGIVIKHRGKDIFLAGGRPRGTLYAVYTFLEDVVGCRWWTSTESTIPSRPDLSIPDPLTSLDKVYVPKLQYREAFYKDAFSSPFAVRCRCNGHFAQIPPEFGGHLPILGWCHTFFPLLPPEQYFERHSEWYSEVDGKRIDNGQLCLTNDEMRAELTRRALEWIRENPQAGFISISQNDWYGRCLCKNCLEVETREESPAGLLIQFVNQVAEEIEKEFPDIWVETLAYQYTRKPPKYVKPRENVVIRLCSIECSFVQPLGIGPQNLSFKQDIEAWSQIAPNLYIWDYVANFRNFLMPHPNLRVLAPNIRFFVDHKALGIFEQGDAWCEVGDWIHLRAWLIAHLLWDPTLDDRVLIREFLQGYYGPAATALERYIDRTHDLAEKSNVYLKCFMRHTHEWLGQEDLVELSGLFQEAERAVAQDPVLRQRVRKARTALDFAWIANWKRFSLEARLRNEPFLGPKDPNAFCQEFIDTVKSFGLTHHREGRPFSELESDLRTMFVPPSPPPAHLPWQGKVTVDVQDQEFDLFGKGTWVETKDDPLASDQRAVRLTGDHTQWAVQYHPDDYLRGTGTWRVYLLCRYEGKALQGDVCQVGVYNEHENKPVMARTLITGEVGREEYAAIDMGVYELSDDIYLWVAPLNLPDRVESIWVDRFFLIRE